MRYLIFILLSLASISSPAQHSVLGQVLEGETNTPLPGATVFIDNTTHHVLSAADGSFMITKLRPLHYNLVISYTGYEAQVVDVLPGEPLAYKVILKPAEKSPKVITEKSRAEMQEDFQMLNDHVIGRSDNHRQCIIRNPGILSFERKDGTLKAFADSTLVIENRGLGYRINILLNEFEYDTTSSLTNYQAHTFYEPLKPGDQKEAKRWAQNRLKAYNGSVMHFLRAFYNRKLNDEGFYFNLFTEINQGKWSDALERTTLSDSVKTAPSPVYNNKPIRMATITDYNLVIDSLSFPEEPMLDFVGDLEVTYIMEEEGYLYQQAHGQRPQRKPQRSELTLSRPAVIQPHGEVYPQDAIAVRGYWSWELVSEHLPLDYDPAIDLKTIGGK